MKYALVRSTRLDLDTFAQATDTHPEMVLRLVELGILEAERDRRGDLWFTLDRVADMARIQRLRTGFALNYAALGLVMDLLDRISVLEAALRRSRRRTGGRTWT